MLLRDRVEAPGPAPARASGRALRPPALATIRLPLAIALLAALGAGMVLSRRPDAVSNPQFWAEDGANWFAEAYDRGSLHALLLSHTGYFQTLPRLVAAAGQRVGLAGAPLLFNGVGLALQILPALFLLSRRFEAAIPSLGVRCILGALYLAIPNFEVHANITNAQWHLAILAFMVVVATPGRRWWWRVFDLSVLVVCGLSGPFVILLAPIALAVWVTRRARWALLLTGVSAAFGLLQGLTALSGDRSAAPLGASPRLLGEILLNRVLLPGMMGEQGTRETISAGWSHGGVVVAVLAVTAVATVALALWRGPLELRLLLAYGALLLGLTLQRPLVDPVRPQWEQIALGNGTRYFLIPVLAWVVTLAWLCSRAPRRLAPALAGTLLLVFAAGDATHWQYPPFTDLHPAAEAARLSRAPAGTTLRIPINPPGWFMVLTRR